jgi:hypothetical protein
MAMKQRLVRLATGVIVALSTSVTHAALITFDYTATRIGGGIVTGTLGYDNSIGDTYPADPTQGLFLSAGFLTGSVSGGSQDGEAFNKSGISVLTSDNYTPSPIPPYVYSDSFSINDGSQTFIEYLNEVSSTSPPPVNLPPLDSDQLTSPLLPGILSDLTQWPYLNYVSVFDGVNQEIYQLMQVRQVSQAPEPSALALLGIGIAGMGFARKKKQAVRRDKAGVRSEVKVIHTERASDPP